MGSEGLVSSLSLLPALLLFLNPRCNVTGSFQDPAALSALSWWTVAPLEP